jgi:hypothetical protein
MAGSDLVKFVTHNVTRWRHTHTHHVSMAPRPTQDIHHVTMGRVNSIHTTITPLRPKQCVCGYGCKRSRCNNNNNIKRLQCTWYYQITIKHKLWQPYNISCFYVFGRRLKTMVGADCRVWNFSLSLSLSLIQINIIYYYAAREDRGSMAVGIDTGMTEVICN